MNHAKSLAKQLGQKGIRVNGCGSGPIWTPLQVSGGATVGKTKAVWQRYGFKETRTTGSFASIYVQLAANDASFTTGNIYGAGGGKGQP